VQIILVELFPQGFVGEHVFQSFLWWKCFFSFSWGDVFNVLLVESVIQGLLGEMSLDFLVYFQVILLTSLVGMFF